MQENKKTVFISYCWTTQEHEKWVLELAEKLMDSVVDVKLDKWDLAPGNDTYAFMEQMVTNPDIDKVLIVCDKGYKIKADGREGGVGTETRIITPEVYNKVDQNKFIPIIVEKGENEFMEYVPVYAKGMLGIDMTSDDRMGESFEELLRCIYEKPRYKKPALGNNIPSFLREDRISTSVSLKLKNDEIKKYIDRDFYTKVFEESVEFRSLFLNELEKFIVIDLKEAETKCKDYIDELKEIRDQYLIRIKLLISYLKDDDLEDIIVEDLEKIYKFSEYTGNSSYNEFTFGHFKFLIHEIFLWINVLLLKSKRYSVSGKLIVDDYYVDTKFSGNKKNMGDFYDCCGILDNYKTSDCNRISINADKMIERSTLKSIDYKRDLIITDLLIYYASILNKNCEGDWFPRLYIFHERNKSIKEFEKMKEKRYFDKIKCIFGFETLEELKEESLKAFPIGRKINGYHNAWCGIPNINNLIGFLS